MGLLPEGFEMIKTGKKTLEVRLNDEKRQQIHTGDMLEFALLPERREKLKARVLTLTTFKSFKDLYTHTAFELMGRQDKSMDWMMAASYNYYTKADEAKYGVLAIKFELVE